ncbi:MAG: glutamate synthase subunit alpha, partial [Acidobacteria bacterium]|nr:glutamate synthase subunit alpha [Acidobacteriota bacterium]
PWELGLAETQQVLVTNQLRDRIVVQTDGQMKTGRDVVIAALLGAEEYGFSTAPLVVSGCIMMRVCHLDTCPVGIATQNPELREHFTGKPEFVENYFRFVAEEVRELMATMGFRTLDEMIGRVDRIDTAEAIDHWKAKGLDLSQILHNPDMPESVARRCVREQDHGLDKALDNTLIDKCRSAIDKRTPVSFTIPVRNVNRTVGTMLGSEITRRWGRDGLPDGTIDIRFTGSAGQSFGAFVPQGVTLTIEGDANDYFGKGLSGGRLAVFPPADSTFVAEKNIIIGNVALYGGTGGEAFVHGVAGERFGVRNSGVHAVVEGICDHGCEYMTGGRVVVLGSTGRNFAAGMSGGIAYVLDERGNFASQCNLGMVDLEQIDDNDAASIHRLVTRHVDHTLSRRGRTVLDEWNTLATKFVKVMPRDYKRVLMAKAKARAESREPGFAELVGSGAD